MADGEPINNDPTAKPVASQESSPDNQPPVQGESKNARKKRLRAQKLLNDPIFNTESSEKKTDSKPDKSEDKPLDVKKTLASAKKYASKLEGPINTYFSMRKAMVLVKYNEGMAIEPMTVAKFGPVMIYLDDKMDVIEGTLSEAVAFYMIVLSGGTTKWFEGFIKRHPNIIAVAFLGIITFNIEASIRTNAMIIEQIEKKDREAKARETQKTYENTDIHVVSVDDGTSR